MDGEAAVTDLRQKNQGQARLLSCHTDQQSDTGAVYILTLVSSLQLSRSC